MYFQSISGPARIVLEKIAASAPAKDFYLAGGTALALQLGHRESIDLDWFSQKFFLNSDLKKILAGLGKFELVGESEGTINGVLDNVKISFFHYDYMLLFPFVSFESVNLADERDIAAMKISAISSRGSKKDFIDIYFLLGKYALGELIDIFEKKYKNIKYNKLHILKSLVYFDDAENEPMPKMLQPVEWGVVKEKIKKEANELLVK
jgi:hypothetical protein